MYKNLVANRTSYKGKRAIMSKRKPSSYQALKAQRASQGRRCQQVR